MNSQGQAYCKKYIQEIEVISGSGVVSHTLGRRGLGLRLPGHCVRRRTTAGSWS